MKLIAFILMTLFVLSAQVGAREYSGDWVILEPSENSGFSESFTMNSSGSKTGYICDPSDQKCFFYLWPSDTTCESGHKQLLLMSSDEGTQSVKTVCISQGKVNLLVFSEYDKIFKVYKNSNNVGFAAGMSNGNFKSFKFSLRGSAQAIKKTALKAIQKSRPASSSKDVYF